MRWVGHVTNMGATRNAHKILAVKPERKKPCRTLGINRRIISE